MAKTIEQIEKNVSASFGYVKKDMLMLNDAFSDIHEKIQHLSMKEQEQELEKVINKWRNSVYDQVDDICIMGVKI